MLRSKKDVDRHVLEAFRNITNDKERNLRCYNVAKLYFKVGDFHSTKQYVELYIKEQPKAAGAHKLLGQALEAMKDYSKALEEYKCSLTLESRQPDLVLKVCELLVESKTRLNAGEAKYWIERAEEVSSSHQAVFRLKEYLIKMEDGSGDQSQLAQLVEKEIEARPYDHTPRIRLLNLYLDTHRVLDAYKYAIDLESRCLFRDNVQWYSYLIEVFKAYYKDVKNLDAEFFINELCVTERYATLCAREQLGGHSSIYTLDQACFRAWKYCQKGGEQLLEECVKHAGGQLCFHLATAVLRLGKQSRTGWKDWTPFAWALMSIAYAIPETIDFASHSSIPSGRDKQRMHLKLWKEDRAFRCSQAGHILLSLVQERRKFVQLSAGHWRERVFKALFAAQVKSKPESEKSSYFLSNTQFADVQEISPSTRDIAVLDDASQHQRPDSLHSLVWLGLRYLEPANKQFSTIGNPYILPYRLSPNFSCHLFEELKFSTMGLENGGVETLSRLDVDTFLCASVFCAAAAQEERQNTLVLGEGRPSVLPVDLTDPLCTDTQSKWWSCAYRLHTNKSRSDIGDVRMTVGRGLEVVRLLGNHGMDVRLIVLLAKLFTEKASSLSTPKDNIPDLTKRAHLFWQRAIYLLERMEKNQPLRMPENSLFSYCGKDLKSSEIRLLLEEGRFFMACRLMKEEKYEKAVEAFQDIKNPYASFYEGLIYKKLADAELDAVGTDKLTGDMKSNYVILLEKSRSALHLTLDRLRAPHNAGNHPLNADLEQHLEEVENCLAREETDFVISGVGRNIQGGLLDESYSSNRFEDSLHNASRLVNTSVHHTGVANGQSPSHGLTSTPFKSRRIIESSINLDASSRKVEARPSPERLDAQMKRMSITTDHVMQIVVEQNRQMLDSNKSMMDALEKTRGAVEDLQKQMADLKMEVGKLKRSDNISHQAQMEAGKLKRGDNGSHQAQYSARVWQPPVEEYDYDEAAMQLNSLQAYPSSAPYGHLPGQAYNYDNRTSNSVQMQAMLPQALFPQAQLPLARNVDPNLLLASYYPQAALGLNYVDRQGAGGMPLTGLLPGTAPNSMPPPAQNSSIPMQSESAAEPYKKSSLLGTPLISQPNISTPAVDLSTSGSVPHSQLLPSHDLTAQRFSFGQQQSVQTPPIKTPLSAVETMPHNFQISMPAQATIPTTESLEKSLSPLKPISTEGILPNVPLPKYSAVDVKLSRVSTGSAGGNETFTEDADYNPCADFKPIIPLPEEITVVTGEEDETALFVRRAKLFRFEKEWKERGVGDIKILKHNVTGKLRILMRREQILKTCANHFILPEMELAPQTGSDRAWSWGANDFADGEARVEKLCVRFKTIEDAQQFKEVFDQARKLAKEVTPVKGPPPISSAAKTEANTAMSQSSITPGKVELGGFSFIQPPVLKPVDHQAKVSPRKDKESAVAVSKPSPFAGFSFTPPATSSSIFGSVQSSTSIASPATSVSASKYVFGSSSSPSVAPLSGSLFPSKAVSSTAATSTASSAFPVFSTSSNLPDFAALAAQNKDKEVGNKESNFKGFQGAGSKVFGGTVSTSKDEANKSTDHETADTEEFEPTAVFNPVIPLPSLVEVKTGEEEEDVLFQERSKLLRFDVKEWKERGVGKMKVLKNRETGKVRLLMRREQVFKVCCNHFITPEIQFKQLTTSDRAVTWSAQDYAEGEVRVEVFALKFKNTETMSIFLDVINNAQKDLKNATPSTPPTAASSKLSGKSDARPLSELFKPKEGSWECSGCFTRNNSDTLSCPCCSQPKPGCEAKVTVTKAASTPQFSFGIPPSQVAPSEGSKPAAGFSFGTSSSLPDKQQSLSELFKPKAGSWECQGCYSRCDADKVECPACQTLKPGCEVKVPVKVVAPTTTQFSFGIKPSQTSAPAADQQPTLAELFKPKVGSWECQGCYSRCDADDLACLACETPKPGHEHDAKAGKSSFSLDSSSTPSTNFSFGISNSSTSAVKSETKGFSFGTVASQAEPKSTFLFGVPSSTTSEVSKGFSFGSSSGNISPTSASSGFVFGASSMNTSQPSFSSLGTSVTSQPSQPQFGSPHKFEFQLRPTSPGKSPGKSPGAPSGEEDSEDEGDDDENTDVGDFKPVVPLPDKVPVTTGEEDEMVLYCHRAKLFRFVAGETGEWKERGLGEIKVLLHNVTNKPRLLMRREQVLKICLNHYIAPDLELIQKDEKTWMWGAQDFSEGVISTERFACRFKTAEIAADFNTAVEKAKAAKVLPSPVQGPAKDGFGSKEDTPAMKSFSFKLPSTDKTGVVRSLFGESKPSSTSDDVEVVYEAKVTPEEKSAALKLELPENFYRYKQAPPCSGCAGCEKDSDSEQSENQQTAVAVTTSSSLFGSKTSLFSSSSFSSPSSTNIFGGTSSQTSAAITFGSILGGGGPVVNSPSTAFPILGSKPSTPDVQEEKSVSFLPVNNSQSFASLASVTAGFNAFKTKDPSKPFSFEGAGAKVFGAGSPAGLASGSGAAAAKKSADDEGEESGGEHDSNDVHDPHFEPIIALPDMVEVRTGEEEEEKLFCQRAKLFRYDSNVKQWKERGVGEMKILKHPVHGTYRLLLRREQVHKVVLNQRLDTEMELQPLKTSDKAWCWGGINHAEDEAGAPEELAIRFKNCEQAEEFRSKFEECQKLLSEAGPRMEALKEDETRDDEEGDDDDDDDDEYEDYEGEFDVLFGEACNLVSDNQGVNVEGKGVIRVIMSAGTHYVEMEDDLGRILCKAPILGDVEVQRNESVCTWKSIDLSDDTGIEKTFVATFESETEADNFQELYSKITIDIVEQTYDYVDRQEDDED